MSRAPGNDDSDHTAMPPPGDATVIQPPDQQGRNPLPIGTRLGEFEINGLIGEGGFGIVYAAFDHSLGRKVALKEYMPSSLAYREGAMTVAVKSVRHQETFDAGMKSFINEARLLAQFDHPSLVKVFRFWEDNHTAYMVMPFYEGVTLKQALASRDAPLDEAWLKSLLRPMLDALAVMHAAQCFHRDIAPDNILILEDGKPLLLDFGAARRVIGDMTHALTVILKPGYAPVEQYADAPGMQQGPWTDIYALAAVLYYAIVGKAPIPSVARMMSDSLEPLARSAAGRFSEPFLQAIDTALAVRPENRPQTIGEFRDLLGLRDRRRIEATTAMPQTDKRRAPQSGGNRKAVTIAAGIVAALGIGAAAYFMTRSSPPPVTATTAPADTAATITPAEKPAPPAVAPPPVAAPERRYDPIAALDEVFDGRSRERAVSVSVKNPLLRIERDHFSFTISSSQGGYVYVLMVGADNADLVLLFPNAKDRDNRLRAGTPMDLPRPSWRIVAGGPPGTDHLMAIVSDTPRDFAAAGIAPSGNFAVAARDVAQTRYREYAGSAPLFAGKPACEAGRECSEAYGAAGFSIEEVAAR